MGDPVVSPLSEKLKAAQSAIAETTGATTKVPPLQIKMNPKPTVPDLLSNSHVLFSSFKLNLGAQFGNKMLKFVDGYYQTADSKEIKYLRDNAEHFELTEVKQ